MKLINLTPGRVLRPQPPQEAEEAGRQKEDEMAKRCECGAIAGERCERMDASVEVRWVPPYLRATAQAAGGDQIRPYADVLTLSPACAEAWAETEGEWLVEV